MTDRGQDQDGAAPARESELKRSVTLLADQILPLEVGRLEVDSDGYLRARETGQPLAFRFAFRGFEFDVLVNNGEPASVRLEGALGRVPFTAESSAGRRLARSLVTLAGKLNRGRLILSAQGEIMIEAETVPPAPRTPISIMASVATLLLEAKPHIELIAELLKGQGQRQPDTP